MANIKTTYLGLKLENPLLVASCSLSKSVDKIKKIADAGAGGVIVKSLFEEQMDSETREIEEYITPSWHTEAYDYVRNMGMQLGPTGYVDLIEKAKSAVTIPIIASLNCISPKWWSEYAKKLENAGADALELNIAYLPVDVKRPAQEVESLYYTIVEKVIATAGIPLAVKIGPYFSSMASFAKGLTERGVGALVMFNRFYQTDIDVEAMKLTPGYRFSTPDEVTLPLRWIALLAEEIECEFSATTGVHSGFDIVKYLLAGAQTVQACSVLYQKGLDQIRPMLETLSAWMDRKGFTRIEDFRGKLSRSQGEKPELWERLQYIQALVGIE
jgi:dihydroorotate dehydrogenase (fumarate)